MMNTIKSLADAVGLHCHPYSSRFKPAGRHWILTADGSSSKVRISFVAKRHWSVWVWQAKAYAYACHRRDYASGIEAFADAVALLLPPSVAPPEGR